MNFPLSLALLREIARGKCSLQRQNTAEKKRNMKGKEMKQNGLRFEREKGAKDNVYIELEEAREENGIRECRRRLRPNGTRDAIIKPKLVLFIFTARSLSLPLSYSRAQINALIGVIAARISSAQ